MVFKGLDNKEKIELIACAVDKVTGDLEVVDWKKVTQNWKHLRKIKFPVANRRLHIDVLISADYIGLHKSIREVAELKREPISRLTPMGWTCVGKVGENGGIKVQTHFFRIILVKLP